MSESNWPPPESLKGLASRAWILGALGVLASIVGFFINRDQFFQSYLVSWLFWIQLTLGCLGIMMLHHLSGGAWGLMIRRILEAASRTLPVMSILFIPILAVPYLRSMMIEPTCSSR